MEDMPTGSYVCECGRSFGSEMALTDHAREEHNAEDTARYECPECHAVLGTRAELDAHWEAHSSKEERADDVRTPRA